MKFLDRVGLVLFSTIVLLISVILCLIAVDLLEVDIISDGIDFLVTDDVAMPITMGVSAVCILLSLKCIFFSSGEKKEKNGKGGILLQNDNGKLLVSKDTIESLTNSVVKNFEAAQNVTSTVEVDSNSNLKIFVTLYVFPDAVIKDITAQIQKDIKDAVKNSLDLEVKEINVRIKNIAPKKESSNKE